MNALSLDVDPFTAISPSSSIDTRLLATPTTPSSFGGANWGLLVSTVDDDTLVDTEFSEAEQASKSVYGMSDEEDEEEYVKIVDVVQASQLKTEPAASTVVDAVKKRVRKAVSYVEGVSYLSEPADFRGAGIPKPWQASAVKVRQTKPGLYLVTFGWDSQLRYVFRLQRAVRARTFPLPLSSRQSL